MRTLVYLSFSYEEDEYRNELREVLLSDVRLRNLFWDDKLLPDGEDWREVMSKKVAQARIMIMLVSPRYLDPNCQAWTYEIPQAIEAFEKGDLTIMWVPARQVRVSDTPFPHLQSAHPISQALDSLSFDERQMAYQKLKQKIIEKLGLAHPNMFDVFLSHNSKDKPEVKQLGEALKKLGISVWLDEWELQPGLTWMDALEDIVTTCKSAAICIGHNGMGPWEEPEMKALLRRFVNEKKSGNILPVIPILLPGAPDTVKLPPFLEDFTWVDLRSGLKKDGLDRVQWGVTGVKPAV